MLFKKKEDAVDAGIIEDLFSSEADEIQKIQYNIELANIDDPIKVFGITSSQPSEGKSTLTVNLGKVYRHRDKKILIIDADLRHPTINKIIHKENKIGLVDYIAGKATLKDIIVTVDGGVDYIFSGSKTLFPSSVFESKKMETFMNEIKSIYDYILVDTAPINVVSDTLLIAKYLQGYLLVVKAKQTKKRDLKEAVSLLRRNSINIIGTVINNVEKNKKSNHYYYYK